MTPEQLREAAAVMLAAADGKPLQVRSNDGRDREWKNIQFGAWNWSYFDYRIKPEPRKIGVRLYEGKEGYIRALTHAECVAAGWKPVSDIVEIEVKDE